MGLLLPSFWRRRARLSLLPNAQEGRRRLRLEPPPPSRLTPGVKENRDPERPSVTHEHPGHNRVSHR
ncbi:hypothetical protein NDU88_006052 [Pleurodeles waltl]|uniref:Uncharacterized protein n=1 Tax=Pleurodeles waltl TaxID=8319 RepID=A0AAV7PJU4_PLEWA|nr:hypothetical protein NDU88_006052 [Pleurodeles waltl]